MNQVHLVGTLKFDPKLQTFNSGKAKASALIETPPADGQQYPDRVEVVGWENEGMALADLKQGDAVEVHGRVKTESWDDRDSGRKIYKQVVIASSVASPSRSVRAATATAAAAGKFDDDDSLPF